MMRLSAMEGGVVLTALRSGLLDDEQWGRISQSLDQFAQWDQRLIIDDCSHQTPRCCAPGPAVIPANTANLL